MYHHVFVAGTFDGLHKGHQAVLTRAFAEGKHVTVGLTPDTFVRNIKHKENVKNFEDRKKGLVAWLGDKGWLNKAEIIAIADQYEPAASDTSLDGLVVTSHNRPTGEKINKMRENRGLSPLVLLEVPMISADDGKPISATRVREGEIDENGKLVMPNSLRGELGKPLGDVLSGATITQSLRAHKGKTIVAVGDVTTKTLIDTGIIPTLAIVDLRVGRKPSHIVAASIDTFQPKIQSGPGFISKGAIKAIGRWGERLEHGDAKIEVLIIDGEEDLLVLPAVITAPLGAVIYYGQPNEGMVEVVVTKEKKKEVIALLKQFTQQ